MKDRDMKTNKLGWISAITIAGLMALSPIANAQQDNERPNREGRQRGQRGNVESRVKRMAEQLTLDEAQQKKLTAIYEAQGKEFAKLREVPQEERREKMTKLRETYNAKVLAILNPEQKKTYAKLQEQRRQRGGQDGDRPRRQRQNDQ